MLRHHNKSKNEGIVLFTVLLLVVLLSLVVILLLAATRRDRTRSRQFLVGSRAEMLVDTATQEVLAKLMDGGEIPYQNGRATASMTAAPGMMEVRDYTSIPNRGYQLGRKLFTDPNSFARKPFAPEFERNGPGDWQAANPRMINLFSHRWYAPGIRYITSTQGVITDGNPDYNPARRFNINTTENPYTPGELYLSGPASPSVAVKDGFGNGKSGSGADKPVFNNQGKYRFNWGETSPDKPVYVQWLPVYEHPDRPPIYTNAAAQVLRNPVVGRYAYWVDLENTKVNLSTSDRLFEDSDWFGLLGISDAEHWEGNGAVFGQYTGPVRPQNTCDAVKARWDLEKTSFGLRQAGPPITVAGVLNDPGDNAAASTYFEQWLSWRPDGSRPYCADNSMIDWRCFTGIRPYSGGRGVNITVEGLLDQAGNNPQDIHFNTAAEGYSLLDPKAEQLDRLNGLTALKAMRRTYGNAVTIYGWDEERDPLGRPRIDITGFQREYRQRVSGGGRPGGTIWDDLKSRLSDPAYYSAYYPGAYPTHGKNISLSQSLNITVGDSDQTNDNNGDMALTQMLVNIGEYSVHPDTPPYIDRATGIVGARSIPYVAEVATRARNGLWDVADSEGTNVFSTLHDLVEDVAAAAGPALPAAVSNLVNWTDAQSLNTLSHYLTNAVIDLSFGMANPNPFSIETANPAERANHRYDGELLLDYEWTGGFPVTDFPETADGVYSGKGDIQGVYTTRPVPERPFESMIRVDGDAPYIRLGMIPGVTLDDPSQVRALKIKGWKIQNSHGLFHEVPIRHPGQTAPPREWWEMAQGDYNVGEENEASLLAFRIPHFTDFFGHMGADINVFQPMVADWENVAVGWFPAWRITSYINEMTPTNRLTTTSGLGDLIYLKPSSWSQMVQDLSDTNGTVRADAAGQLQTFLRDVKDNPAMVERVFATDPVVGHRTGNPDAKHPGVYVTSVTSSPKGHFYGVNGHPWRRFQRDLARGHWEEIEHDPEPIRGPRPDPETHTVIVRVPAGNTFVEAPRDVTYRPPAPIIGHIPAWTERKWVPGQTPMPWLTDDFNHADKRQIRQGELGRMILDYRLQRKTPAAFYERHSNLLAVECDKSLNGLPPTYVLPIPKSDSKRFVTPWWYEGPHCLPNTGIFSYFTQAPRGELMSSIGEIGFVHSGSLGRAIDLTRGRNSSLGRWGKDLTFQAHTDAYFLNTPQNGPGQHMLLDIFCPGAFRDNASQSYLTKSQWENGSYTPYSPQNPRRGTWCINSMFAYDGYLAVREGDATEIRWDSPAIPMHPYWVPSATARGRVPDPFYMIHGPDAHRNYGGGQLRQIDPLMMPFPRMRRGFESWISVIGGDYTPWRSRGSGVWHQPSGSDPSYYNILPSANFAWNVGWKGAAEDATYEDRHANTTVNFDPQYGGAANLLTKGTLKHLNPGGRSHLYGWLEKRPSADAHYQPGQSIYGSDKALFEMARFDVFPMRHHISEILGESDIALNNMATALNARQQSAKFYWHQVHAGGHTGKLFASGIYANAPMALVANQMSTSANVFTIHIVTESLRDIGVARTDKGTPTENLNTGTGFMDASDEVTAQHWSKVVVAKKPDLSGRVDPLTGGPLQTYEVLYRTIREHAQ